METVRLFGLELWKAGFRKAVSALESVIWDAGFPPKIAVTLNVDNVVKIHRSDHLLEMYRCADFVFPDGFPVFMSARLLGKRIEGRVTGADLFPAICRALAARKGKAFIFGGRPGTEEHIQKELSSKYPDLGVLAYSPAYGFSEGSNEARTAIEMVNAWEPQVVFACLGMPKQELWAFRYRGELRTKLVLCVGAALDFEVGVVKRAPGLVQAIGREWLWRLCKEPGRLWKRYLIEDLEFLKVLCREFAGNRTFKK